MMGFIVFAEAVFLIGWAFVSFKLIASAEERYIADCSN